MGLAEPRGLVDIAVTEELNPWLWHLYVFMLFCVSCLFPFGSSLTFSQVILEVPACLGCAKGNQRVMAQSSCGPVWWWQQEAQEPLRGEGTGKRATFDQLPLPTAASSP